MALFHFGCNCIYKLAKCKWNIMLQVLLSFCFFLFLVEVYTAYGWRELIKGGKHAKYLVQNKKALFIKCLAHTQIIVLCCFSNKSCDPVICYHITSCFHMWFIVCLNHNDNVILLFYIEALCWEMMVPRSVQRGQRPISSHQQRPRSTSAHDNRHQHHASSSGN